MKESARQVAYQVLAAVEERQAYANLQLTHLLNKSNLARLDRAFVTELVLGVLRRQNALDYAINQFLERPGKLPKEIRRILRLGFYQVLFLDRVPKEVATNETVEQAKGLLKGKFIALVNGVMRQLARKESIIWPTWEANPLQYLVVVESHPKWLVERWVKQYGLEKTRAICERNNQSASVSIRVNALRIDRQELLEDFAKEQIEAKETAFSTVGLKLSAPSAITALPGFWEGLFTVQDESSMVIAPILNPQPGETIIDACSAPGGKTTHLAELSKDEGTIHAWDIHPHKLGLIRQNCERLGINSVTISRVDAQEPPKDLHGQVDRILVDAPCSGLGVLRRKPELRYRITEKDIISLKSLQAKILDGLAPLLRSGGILVYSTCTIEPEENFQQVKDFLQRHPDFEADELLPYIPELDFSEEEKRQIDKGFWQILPHRYQTDGFFVARLRRK
ncbi:16S rRNA (cytosine(967)-C(5))-methyltransferase RsmB [Heliorestis acidaminivorans]|uniref:16S rRNA (cytosine(967)-C(5))-methyltransferase n=1 Tax=Heliorestis acidaminivorans TaxID=553427 RepID=A0A6I0F3Y8_9FIRM|nr:16S rRNA (cytosine(967)-C(5))-methyltransferase RsmB [Heliorestis acidaminivorans]KAB2954470.1 16S rRNA (cytosine(967)-C(5))-methyltransferase RsmB [Heliorestis acidaminivorans]